MTDVDYYIYSNTGTKFAFISSSFSPNAFLLDNLKLIADFQVVSADARSNQVVFRTSIIVEWIDKPFLIWRIIESILWSRLQKAQPVSEQFFI